ncbi:hypothetical protein SAMN05428975_5088 [Mucilaginibacter sp. OK268]|nr:hypothetical protein SAMN05428975_5088 [Mucilaginibacter sp. OK268]
MQQKGAKLLHIKALLCTFALLIEKGGGIRPCDVLATCTIQGATFYSTTQKALGKISESQSYTRLFEISCFFRFEILDVRYETASAFAFITFSTLFIR